MRTSAWGDNNVKVLPLAIQIRAALPMLGDATLSVEDQARSVLHLLVDRLEDSEWPQIPIDDPFCCPNCEARVESIASPYCSERCRDEASFIRQFRAAVSTGTILTPDKQVVFGERLWWLLGGGLPRRESNIPESAKRQVAKRCGGKCETCGSPMTAVENIGSGCNRPLHLRAVCDGCSQTKSYGDLEFSESPQAKELLDRFATRVGNILPIRPCDDSHAWDWRAFVTKRRGQANQL